MTRGHNIVQRWCGRLRRLPLRIAILTCQYIQFGSIHRGGVWPLPCVRSSPSSRGPHQRGHGCRDCAPYQVRCLASATGETFYFFTKRKTVGRAHAGCMWDCLCHIAELVRISCRSVHGVRQPPRCIKWLLCACSPDTLDTDEVGTGSVPHPVCPASSLRACPAHAPYRQRGQRSHTVALHPWGSCAGEDVSADRRTDPPARASLPRR